MVHSHVTSDGAVIPHPLQLQLNTTRVVVFSLYRHLFRQAAANQNLVRGISKKDCGGGLMKDRTGEGQWSARFILDPSTFTRFCFCFFNVKNILV